MKLNRKWILVMSLVLSVALATSGTFAYLTDTEKTVNVVTLGNVDITLNEPSWKPEEEHPMLPGDEFGKDPYIENVGKTAAWVWMEVEMPTTLYANLTVDWNHTAWDMEAKTSGDNTVVTLMRSTKLAVDEKTENAFTKVALDKSVTSEDLANIAGGDVDIKVTAYAIQDKPFESIEEAYAAYSADNGSSGNTPSKVEDLVVDGETKTITVNTAKGLLALTAKNASWAEEYSESQTGNNWTDYNNAGFGDYYYTWNWTIKLANDIDLMNRTISPIDVSLWGSIDGQSHTISNVKVNGNGLFTATHKQGDIVKNLTVDNIVVNSTSANTGALMGHSNVKLERITVKNATVEGTKYVGGLVGRASSDIVNCTVINSNITGSDKTAGGLAGYVICETTSATGVVNNNTVEEVSVQAKYNVGGLAGQAQGENKALTVSENMVKTTSVTSTEELPDNHSSTEKRVDNFVARVETSSKDVTVAEDNVSSGVTLSPAAQ